MLANEGKVSNERGNEMALTVAERQRAFKQRQKSTILMMQHRIDDLERRISNASCLLASRHRLIRNVEDAAKILDGIISDVEFGIRLDDDESSTQEFLKSERRAMYSAQQFDGEEEPDGVFDVPRAVR